MNIECKELDHFDENGICQNHKSLFHGWPDSMKNAFAMALIHKKVDGKYIACEPKRCNLCKDL